MARRGSCTAIEEWADRILTDTREARTPTGIVSDYSGAFLVACFFGNNSQSPYTWEILPSGMNVRHRWSNDSTYDPYDYAGSFNNGILADQAIGAGTVPEKMVRSNYEHNQTAGVAIILQRVPNNPPNAPSVADQGVWNRAVTNRVPWSFNDPDAGDAQSAAEVRYSATGAQAAYIDNPNNFWDAPGGTFTADVTGLQVRTADHSP